MLTIHCVSPSNWWIHWENEQCHWVDIKSFQQLRPDKLNFFTADDIINNKKSDYFYNRNLIIFLTSQLWARHYSDEVESDQREF